MPIIFPDEVDIKIVFVGLANSGKTTLVRRLKDPEGFDTEVSPTMGVAIELLEFDDKDNKKVQYLALDCGGQPAFAKAVWGPHCQVANGVVFMFDSTDESSVEGTSLWLNEVLQWMKEGKYKGDTPLLFLANKSDIENALPLKEIIKKLNLDKFVGKSFGVYQISALTGENVEDSLEWFYERLILDSSTES
ncbi:MAG: ADP-ribosylation factor-like protein [Candidatus Hodarchaeales archaeon]|jgi:small GTP-binding protein